MVNATMAGESGDSETILATGLRYLVMDVSNHGFIIKLDRPTPADLKFNWLAIAVKQPKIFTSSSRILSRNRGLIQEYSTRSTLFPKISSAATLIPAKSNRLSPFLVFTRISTSLFFVYLPVA